MLANTGKEDLRSVKTGKALDIAMFSLLENRNFRKITVSDICTSALISRATFYSHFTDKYELLRYWLVYLKPENINISKDDPYEIIEKTVNQFMYKNMSVIKNLLHDANDETLEILSDFIISTPDFTTKKNVNGKINPEYVVVSNFLVGGMLYYFKWHTKNKFPSDLKVMNIHLYEILVKLYDWKS